MNVCWIKTVACGLGLGFSGIVAAGDLPSPHAPPSGQYVPPSRWSNFNPPSATVAQRSPSDHDSLNELGSSLLNEEQILPMPYELFADDARGGGSASAARTAWGSGLMYAAPPENCEPAAAELFPWFGGSDLLFWSVVNESDRRLVVDAATPGVTALSTGDVDPQYRLGYDVFVGRYLDGGHRAVTFNYLWFDPSRESAGATAAAAGDLALALPAWSSIGYYDDPSDLASDFNDLESIFGQMTDYRMTRDLRFQGIELNFWTFGLGGARPVGAVPGSGLGSLRLGRLGTGYASRNRYGFGGLAGPMELPSVNTSQFALSHGFRWFQVRDAMSFSGAGPVTLPVEDEQYYASRARNDLFGYQLGGRWNHSVTPRINVGLGAKMGVYANSVEVDRRIGDGTTPAVYQSDIDTAARRAVDDRSHSTVLAGLGEINLGGGFRLSDAWSVRAGYRVLGLSGIATTPSLLAHEMVAPNLSAREQANDSLILHGAYLGTEFNW